MRALCVMLLGCLCGGAIAAPQPGDAQALTQLLQAVREGRVGDAADASAREQRFLQETAARQQALDAAKRELAVRTARATQQEQVYAANARKLEARRRQLQERLLTLGDVFAHLRAVGVLVRDAFGASLSATQFGAERVARLDRLLASTTHDEALPPIAELENLWFEMQRELVAGGEIVRYRAQRFRPDGESRDGPVVRVGTFNIVAEDGAYLRYVPARGALIEPSLQPDGDVRDSAARFATAREGLHDLALDPSGPRGGELLDILTRRPSAWSRMLQGGWPGAVIMLLGVAGLLIGAAAGIAPGDARLLRWTPPEAITRWRAQVPRLLGIAAGLLLGAGLLGATWRGWQSAGAAALGIGDARRLADALAGDFMVLWQAAIVALLLMLLRAWLLWRARDAGPASPPGAGGD